MPGAHEGLATLSPLLTKVEVLNCVELPVISEEDELVIPAEIHALEFVKEHLPFVFIGARVIVRDGAGDVLDGTDVLNVVTGHIERGFHLVVLRMTGTSSGKGNPCRGRTRQKRSRLQGGRELEKQYRKRPDRV